MITKLFINSCILITFISVSYIFILNKDISDNKSFFSKVLVGAWSGLLGILLMLFSVPINSNVMIDFRYLAILLCTFFEGMITPIIASVIIGGFRVLYFGVTGSSLIALIDALFVGVGFGIISSTKISRKIKWINSIIYLLIVISFSMIILIKDLDMLYKVLIGYSASIIIVSYFMFRYTQYLAESINIHKKLKSDATVDYLTGLNNVRQFKLDFNNCFEQSIRKKEDLSLLFLDIDFFKIVNDTYGHSSGDIVLQNIAMILKNTCRSFDIVSRNGGEEFSVLLLDCKITHALVIAERIRKAVEINEFKLSDSENVFVTISIGVTTYPDITNNIDSMIENADSALYEAKKTGRNKVCTYR